MNAYLYCIRENFEYKSTILNREFDNEWFSLSKDGTVTIKGINKKGYAWDGCSPKWRIGIFDLYFGTPDALLSWKTGKSKTFYASLVHDVFYQFSPVVKSMICRKEIDREFYRILKRDQFALARIYYYFVRWFGWISWYRKS